MTHLVLLGAGHAHVEVLRQAARGRMAGIRITLITAAEQTAYSGLLPALIREEVRHADAHIACAPLAAAAGARLVAGRAVAIDLSGRHVLTLNAGFAGFDLLSIDVGGAPVLPPGEAIAVKPTGLFLDRLAALEATLPHGAAIAVVGGGAGGTELALALAVRLAGHARITLVCPGAPLASAPAAARRAVARALEARGVRVLAGTARGFETGRLALADGATQPFDAAIWATGVAAPGFLARAGLACGPDGAVLTDAGLRSLSHDFVFAAGDCACLHGSPRPKSGVWAVRAGPVLARNLRRAAAGRDIRAWRPQRDALAILGTGHGHAVAWRGGLSLSGSLPCRIKAWIDRRWMARYQFPRDS